MTQWMKSLEVTPTILALRERAEEIKRVELERAFARLGSLSEQERAIVEALAQGMVNKLLHGSLVTLKTEAHTSSRALYIEAARRFFSLSDESGGGRAEHDSHTCETSANPARRPNHLTGEDVTDPDSLPDDSRRGA